MRMLPFQYLTTMSISFMVKQRIVLTTNDDFLTLCQILHWANLLQGAVDRGWLSCHVRSWTRWRLILLEIELTLHLRHVAVTLFVQTPSVPRQLACIDSMSACCILCSHDNLIHQFVLLLPRLLHLLVGSSQWALALHSNEVLGHIVLAWTWIGWIDCRDIPNSLRIGHREHTPVFKHGAWAEGHAALVPALFVLVILEVICTRPWLEWHIAYEVLIHEPGISFAFSYVFHCNCDIVI